MSVLRCPTCSNCVSVSAEEQSEMQNVEQTAKRHAIVHRAITTNSYMAWSFLTTMTVRIHAAHADLSHIRFDDYHI